MNEFEAITDLDKGFAITKLDDKYGFVNENFEVVVEFKYDKVNSFHENFAIVSLVNKSKYVNSQNEEIIPYKYNQMWTCYTEKKIFRVFRLEDKYGFITEEGNEILLNEYKDIILGNRTLYYSKYKGNIIYVMMDKYEYERYIVFFGEKEEFKEWLYKNEVINYDEYINHINKIEQQLLEN